MMQDYCISDLFICKEYAFNFFDSEMQFLLTQCAFNWNASQREAICVAVSGGSDSMALLIMLSNWARKNDVKVYCVTVDHKLRKESANEAIFVQNFCKAINIKHEILEWNRSSNENDILCDNKIEDLARDVRYRLICDFCEKNFIRFILTGHTWNDQLETFEMRKNSGSSDCGLACISRIRKVSNNIALVRPILHFTKEYLQNFLISDGIHWKNDPMNECITFKRVNCRKKVLTYDEKTLMDLYKKIKMLGNARYETEVDAVNFLKDEKKCFFSDFGYAVLDFVSFDMQKTNIKIEIIKRVIWNIGGKKYTININEDILEKIINKKINTIGRCLFKFDKKSISVFRENRNFVDIKMKKNTVISKGFVFDNRFLIKIKETSFLNDDLNNVVVSSHFDCKLKYKKEFDYNYLESLPVNATFGLPCVFLNNKVMSAYGTKHESAEVSYMFLHKMNLFDVFLC